MRRVDETIVRVLFYSGSCLFWSHHNSFAFYCDENHLFHLLFFNSSTELYGLTSGKEEKPFIFPLLKSDFCVHDNHHMIIANVCSVQTKDM